MLWAWLMFCYQAVFRPYTTPVYNFVTSVNELMLVVSGWLFYFVIDADDAQKNMELVGWTIVGLLLVFLCLNMSVLSFIKFKSLYKKCQRYTNRREDSVKQFTSVQSHSQFLRINTLSNPKRAPYVIR